MRSIYKMPSDVMAGDAKRRVPIPKREEEGKCKAFVPVPKEEGNR